MDDEKMDKLRMHSPNLTNENVAKIRDLFPGCVTEAADEKGQLRWVVDFDLLHQELSDHIVEGPEERYRLEWPGKREALFTANAPIAKTMRPCRAESINFDITQNLFIEGDNLEALKLLQDTYLGKVKMIYIDPPYNTGSDLIYEDDFAENVNEFLIRSGQKSEDGSRLVTNPEANGRFHSDWLSMMYSRLKLARNLMREDGAIFISIGDSEVDNLRKICEQIFGGKNSVALLTRVAKRTSDKGTHFRPTKDYVVVFAKSIESLHEFGIQKEPDEKDYPFSDDGRKYKKSGASLYQPSLDSRPNQRYFIEAPDGSLIIPPGSVFPEKHADGEKIKPRSNSDKVWRWSVNTYLKQKNLLIFTEGSAKNPLVDEHGKQSKWNIYPKVYFDQDLESSLHPEDVIYDYPNSQSSKELSKLEIPFSFSKPTGLVKFLVKLMQCSDEIVLDFFSGSSSTADAVMQLNAEDGGNRKFLMVQLPEGVEENSDAFQAGFRNIAEISKERIRRAGKKILQGDCHADWNKDVGFRVLKTDTSNMQDVFYRPDEVGQADLLTAVDNIKPDRNPEDLLFQVLVDWGVDLTLPIRRDTVQDKTVFFVDGDALVACFDTGVTEELVKDLASYKPLRMVFRDNGFVSDVVKINVEQIFRQLSPNTDIKSI
jgi:adenine-specific DNA-methyltransferase